MLKMRWVQSVTVLALVSGCAAGDVYHQGNRDLASELTLLGATAQPIIRKGDGSLCFGPQPDATIDEDGAAGTGSFGVGVGDNELPLGGRNPNVLITRDIFFQSCLAESRLNLDRAERIALFNRTLDLVRAINSASLEGASINSDSDSGSQVIYSPSAPVATASSPSAAEF